MKKLKNVDITIFNETYGKVLQYFFAFPEQAIGLTDLATAVSSSKTTTKETVMHLVNEKFLQKEEVGKAWRISAVSRHSYQITRKMPSHLRLIYETGIVDAIREKIPSLKAIILFGTYRWGTDNEKSDIDIAVEILGNENPVITCLGKIDFGYRKGVIVNLFIFSRNKIDLNLFNNIANGIVLDGLLEVKP
ncbi:MAG: nucleotidyltransferase domain-containing protein [Nanoarchaeota archaeon]